MCYTLPLWRERLAPLSVPSSLLITQAPLPRPGATKLQSADNVHSPQRSILSQLAFRSPGCIFLASMICIFIECAKCYDSRNWIILSVFLLACETMWSLQCWLRHGPGVTGNGGAASVTSGRSGRGAQLGLWLVQSRNTGLWLVPAPFL